MNVILKDMPNLRVATVRHLGPYNQISEAFARLGAIAGKAGLFGPEAAMIAIYYDDPETTSSADLRSDAGIVVSSQMQLPPEVAEQHIPGGRYAVTTHVGAYDRLGDTWTRLMGQWLPRSGHRMRDGGLSFEIYRNTPATAPPDKLETDLYVPLA